MNAASSMVWFREDLRLRDNPALEAARASGGPVIPVFIWAPREDGAWPPGAASRWWLHQSLRSLTADLEKAGARLVIRQGDSLAELRKLAQETGAQAVFWNRRYEPAIVQRDQKIKETLRGRGLRAESFNSKLLHEPWTILNASQRPFQVFTAFWRACLLRPPPEKPLPPPRHLAAPPANLVSCTLAELKLEPGIDWVGGLRDAWEPGERGALRQLQRFLASAFADYGETRNRPDMVGTSRLSPHLHFGEISPRQVWQSVREHAEGQRVPETKWRGSRFLAEIGWREFAHHLLYHFPHTPAEPLREDFKKFPWRKNAAWLKAWQRGLTGYPLVDAGMRELWATGWMHNRVRMVVASFLVKDLLISWERGAAWFWDTLVDADLASNTLGWQWTAGCGADAAPYFRIFNPVSQGENFDPDGEYVRRWVPELAHLPAPWIHKPFSAPAGILSAAAVGLGRTYPRPVVSHAIAREVALEAFARIKSRP